MKKLILKLLLVVVSSFLFMSILSCKPNNENIYGNVEDALDVFLDDGDVDGISKEDIMNAILNFEEETGFEPNRSGGSTQIGFTEKGAYKYLLNDGDKKISMLSNFHCDVANLTGEGILI